MTLENSVNREYLVNTFMSLIGNVGGTLGMFDRDLTAYPLFHLLRLITYCMEICYNAV